MAMTLDELTSQLRAAYGAQLASVVLYGSGATGEHIPRTSDYNVLVLLDHVDMTALAAASAVARAWRDAGNPPPMTMTTSEWRRSADVFPMEYADILDHHRVLHGALPFDGIVISREHLRLQLEQQVMGKLLRLRQATLMAGADGKRQVAVIAASISTIMVLFRATIRLHSETPPTDNIAIVQRVAGLAGIEAEPFLQAVRHQRGAAPIATRDALSVIGQYLTGVERLDAHLDTFTTQEGTP